jgi:Zn-dependent protease with chaperone function
VIPAALLAGYALLAATLGGWLLRRARWPQRAPTLGVAAWQALSVSAVLAVILAGLTVAVPRSALGAGLAELVQACVWALRAEYGPAGPLVGAAGAALAGGVSARTVWCLVEVLVSSVRERRHHAAMLAPIARPHPQLPALVVPHQVAAAYCLPGGQQRIVLTTGALACLNAEQLQCVLAHERAHLRWRHHLPVALARALHRAFPAIPTFRHADQQITDLVEMLADDAATKHGDRHSYAAALVALAEGAAPAQALAAGGPAALARVHRLMAPDRPLGLLRRTATCLTILALLALPLALAATPALLAAGSTYCPVDISGLT